MITEKRFKDERLIAYSAIDKIKEAAKMMPSDDPNHKNGVKYMILKKDYHDIIDTLLEQKCARHMNKESIKSFINTKLKKL